MYILSIYVVNYFVNDNNYNLLFILNEKIYFFFYYYGFLT